MAELVFGNAITGTRCLSLYEQILRWAEVSFERGRFNAQRSGHRFESQNSFSDLKILGFMRVYFVNFIVYFEHLYYY